MSVDDSRRDAWIQMQATRDSPHDTTRLPLFGGGGDGTSGGMERVAKLEAHVETLRADMAAAKKDTGDIRVDIGVIKEKISNLPTKGFVVTTSLTALSFLTAIILFGDRIKALLGLG